MIVSIFNLYNNKRNNKKIVYYHVQYGLKNLTIYEINENNI